jgi:hypothetical protein
MTMAMSSTIHFKNDKLVMESTMGTHHELNSKNFILGISRWWWWLLCNKGQRRGERKG